MEGCAQSKGGCIEVAEEGWMRVLGGLEVLNCRCANVVSAGSGKGWMESIQLILVGTLLIESGFDYFSLREGTLLLRASTLC